MLVVLMIPAALAVMVWRESRDWPDVSRLRTEDPSTTAFLERYRLELGYDDLSRVAWTWVPLEEMSPELARAVLVSEDVDFFSHGGFAWGEMNEAVRRSLGEGQRLRGASTLSQQLAKNLWLDGSRSPVRKTREAVLTWQLERNLSKRRILELYLNVVEFGPGIWGVEAASRHFFGRSARQVDLGQAAQLAAGLPRPSEWHPGSRAPRYLARVEIVRDRAARALWLDELVGIPLPSPPQPALSPGEAPGSDEGAMGPGWEPV